MLFISRKFYPELTGGGQISGLYIVKAVKETGAEVKVLTFTEKGAFEEEIEEIPIERKKIKKLRLFPRFSNLDYMYWQITKESIRKVKEFQPDIIHLLNFESIHYNSFILKKAFPDKKIVATVNGPNFGCFTQFSKDYRERFCIRCKTGKRFLCSTKQWGKIRGFAYYIYSLWYMNLLRFSYKKVDKFLAVSRAMIPLIQNMNIPENKITVIHNPIKIKEPIRSNIKKALNIKTPIILYAGRLAEEKGIQHTIKAIKNINCNFLVLGRKSRYYPQLEKLVKELKIEDKVKFVGFIDNEKIHEYYQIADIVVMTNKFYEPLSRMLLEAGANGIPCIVSNTGGNSEVIKDHKNGLVLESLETEELAKSITLLLSNPDLKKELGRNAKEMIKEFRPEVIGKNLIQQYNELK